MIAQTVLQAGKTAARFRFEALPHLWVVFLVIVPLVLLFAWFLYRGNNGVRGPKRWILTGLRAGAVFLLILALFRPILEKIRTREVRDQVILLVDDSASMGRVDGYPKSEKTDKLAREAGLAPGESPETLTRLDLARRVLKGPAGILEEMKSRFDLALYGFSRELVPLADLSGLQATGRVTRLGEALEAVFPEAVGGRTAAVVLFSDGRSNDGLPPLEAASRFAAEGIPIHTVLCGRPSALKNLAVLDVQAPANVLQKEKVTFKVPVRTGGLGGMKFRISLVRVPGEEVLEWKEVRVPSRGGTQVVTMTHVFDEPGMVTLEARVDPLPGESFLDDNKAVHHLRVLSGKIRVLYIEDYPRYEYRYLKGTLLRADRAVEGQCFLFEASPDFPQEATKGLPHLADIPRTRKELLGKYHVVILGDVAPSLLGDTSRESDKFLQLLKEFVEFGGGLICQAGVRAMPDAYRGTPVEDLLPVVLLEPGDLDLQPGPQDRPFQPVLENPATPPQMLKLLPDPATNRLLWKEGLEGFYWFAPVLRAKAGAQVLLRHPSRKNKYGRMVLAAAWDYPHGRVVWLGLDSFWRWRKYYGDKYFDIFWRNTIRWAAEGRLKRGSDRAVLELSKQIFDVGEKMEVTVRLRDEDFVPSTAPTCKLFLLLPDGRTRSSTLAADPSEAGSYRGAFRFREPGTYALSLREGGAPRGKVLVQGGFRVRMPLKELARPTPDAKLMAEIARATGGKSLGLEEAQDLLEALPAGGTRVIPVGRDPHPRELWDTPWLLFVLIGLLGLEWALRKGAHLP